MCSSKPSRDKEWCHKLLSSIMQSGYDADEHRAACCFERRPTEETILQFNVDRVAEAQGFLAPVDDALLTHVSVACSHLVQMLKCVGAETLGYTDDILTSNGRISRQAMVLNRRRLHPPHSQTPPCYSQSQPTSGTRTTSSDFAAE